MHHLDMTGCCLVPVLAGRVVYEHMQHTEGTVAAKSLQEEERQETLVSEFEDCACCNY